MEKEIKVGDKVVVCKGNMPTLTVQFIMNNVVWFEETNDSCLISECVKIEQE